MFCERIKQTGVLVEAECLKMEMQKSEYTSVLKNNSVSGSFMFSHFVLLSLNQMN